MYCIKEGTSEMCRSIENNRRTTTRCREVFRRKQVGTEDIFKSIGALLRYATCKPSYDSMSLVKVPDVQAKTYEDSRSGYFSEVL